MKVTFHVFISLTLLFQSVKEQAYDYHSAIYHLLQDKYKKHPKTIQKTIVPQNLPLAVVSTERRSSITTGIGMYHYTLEPYRTVFVAVKLHNLGATKYPRKKLKVFILTDN